MKRLDELTLKLVDQVIAEGELRELGELAESAEGRASFLQLMKLEAHLQTTGRLSLADRVLLKIHHERCGRVEEAVMLAVTEPDASGDANAVVAGNERSVWLVFTVVGMAVIAVCILVGQCVGDRAMAAIALTLASRI